MTVFVKHCRSFVQSCVVQEPRLQGSGKGELSRMTNQVHETGMRAPLRRTGGRSAVEVRVLKMIESGTAYKITDLASQLRMSTSHLQRLFKRETGVRIGEWLNTQRLQKAAYLLANSYLSVKEIAGAAGYEHLSSFIRAFERLYVVTPTRYRESADEGRQSPRGGAA
jgi:AraC-like DNA-binding protein